MAGDDGMGCGAFHESDMTPHSRDAMRRVCKIVCAPFRLKRAQGKPGARCTGSRAQCAQRSAHRAIQVREATSRPFPCAIDVLRFPSRSPWATGRLATILPEEACASQRTWTPASGRRDHTTSRPRQVPCPSAHPPSNASHRAS